MQAFFQGKVDNFCAVYAVLNALQLLYAITPLDARRIFNRTLMNISADREAFRRVLEHKTDYVVEVDAMLADIQAHEFPGLSVHAPLGPEATCEQAWEVLRASAVLSLPRVAVFRFMRFTPSQEKPYVDHWTTGRTMDTQGLHFFDCSIEEGGLYCLPYAKVTDRAHPLSRDYVVIPPESIRILSAAGSAALPV